MLRIVLLIVLVFLLARGAMWMLRRLRDAYGSASVARRLIAEGRIDATAFADAAREGARRGRMSLEQRHMVREARLERRREYLEGYTPSLYQYLIIFLVASVLGLVLETIYTFLAFGIVESRVGLVWGPFSPLYGLGAVLLTMCLWEVRDRPWWQVFLMSAALGGTLEQCAGWGLEHFADAQSWTYLGLPDHITQWIAWRFLFMWGVIGLVWCRLIMPELIYRIGEPTTRKQAMVATFLAIFMVLDIAITLACFWRAGQRHQGDPPDNGFEVYIDTHFDDAFMARTFENMRIGEDLPPAPR